MTITVSRRSVAATVALIVALVGGGLVALSGGSGAASAASGSPRASVQCVGTKSGNLTPGKTNNLPGVPLSSANHEIDAPFDATSGLPTGQLVDKPYTFTLSSRAGDDTNIVMTAAMVNHETLKQCTFRYFAPNAAGEITVYLTVVLTNAKLTSYRFASAGTVQWQATYSKIQWTGKSKTAQADWSTPSG